MKNEQKMNPVRNISSEEGSGNLFVRIFKSNNIMLFIVLIVVVVLFSVLKSSYFSTTTAINILNAASAIGFLAIGETYLIIAGHIDLSSGYVAAFAGVMLALVLKAGVFWPACNTYRIGVWRHRRVFQFGACQHIQTAAVYRDSGNRIGLQGLCIPDLRWQTGFDR